MSKRPEILKTDGILHHYSTYSVGSVERAKAELAWMWSASRSADSSIRLWDNAKQVVLDGKAWDVLGFTSPHECLIALLGEKYELIEYGKVHIDKEGTIAEAEQKGRSEMARQMKAENPELGPTAIGRMVGCDKTTVRDALVVGEIVRAEPPPPHLVSKESAADFRKLSTAGQDRVRQGEPLNRVALAEGVRKRLSPLEQAQKAFRRLTREDRDAFDLWRNEQPL